MEAGILHRGAINGSAIVHRGGITYRHDSLDTIIPSLGGTHPHGCELVGADIPHFREIMDKDKLIHEEITPGGNHGYRCTVLYRNRGYIYCKYTLLERIMNEERV